MNKKRKKYRKETKKGKKEEKVWEDAVIVDEKPDHEWSVGNE